jgi:hypothetical protein
VKRLTSLEPFHALSFAECVRREPILMPDISQQCRQDVPNCWCRGSRSSGDLTDRTTGIVDEELVDPGINHKVGRSSGKITCLFVWRRQTQSSDDSWNRRGGDDKLSKRLNKMAMYFCRRLALSVKGEDIIRLADFHDGRLNVQKDDRKERLCFSTCCEV